MGTNKSTNICKYIFKNEKRKREGHHQNEKICLVLNVRRVPQKSEGATARRLPMFYEKVIEQMYKTEDKETPEKQKMN